MNLYRTFAEILCSPSTGKRFLHPIVVFQSSLYSTSWTTKQRYTRKQPKPEPSYSESNDHNLHHPHDTGFSTEPKLPQKDISIPTDWPRPSEIPWQAKVANLVNLIGSVAMPIQFQASPDGKYWAGTILAREKTLDLTPLWIPIIFEGDLAHIAACHLKEKDLVHVAGRLSGDPPQFTMEHGQSNVQVMVHSVSFVQESRQRKESYTSYKKDEQAFNFSAKKDDFSIKHSWNDLLAKPHERWDNRLNKNNPTGAAFEHKDNGQLLWIDESTSGKILSKSESSTFENKTLEKSHKSTNMVKDGESKEDPWRDLVDNPNQWKDHRKNKLNGLVNPRYPDFKRKDDGQSLWLGGAPEWVLLKLEGLEFDVRIYKTKKGKDNKEEESWKNLVENPDRWWDNRSNKINKKSPDFKHKDTGEGLWLDSSPDWVLPKLPPVKPKDVAVAVAKRCTLLS